MQGRSWLDHPLPSEIDRALTVNPKKVSGVHAFRRQLAGFNEPPHLIVTAAEISSDFHRPEELACFRKACFQIWLRGAR